MSPKNQTNSAPSSPADGVGEPVGPTPSGRFKRPAIVLTLVGLAAAAVALADYSRTIPESVKANYVGRQTCAQCHQQQASQFSGSHHDLAMDVASEDSVLGDFNDAKLEHYGIESRMFRDGEKYMIHTEGPDGSMADFEIKYVFGHEPLQQYMVEFDRGPQQPESEVARVQVLRVSWDTAKKKWFYLSPPDVHEKLAPDDDLHWTGIAQRWNNMCADCHSTNLRRNHDVKTDSYHTTFSEIDVSCESCHGPGSVHVQLANRTSLFWDRKRGYGLAKLKGKQHAENQVMACAPCHSRRRIVNEDYHAGADFADHFAIENLTPQTYHCDGQIQDEVYVVGSFLQSKMYHKGIRCTDCHDPHTAKLKHQGNQVCTSCHQHSAGKYDNPSHHFHKVGSEGAKCVNCHMPSTTYMAVDPRRDHSLRVPRPDLSVSLGAPNACTGCHLDRATAQPNQKLDGTPLQYKDWMLAAHPVDGSQPDATILEQLKTIDQWAADQCDQWYGADRDAKKRHFAEGLHAAWNSPEQQLSASKRWMRPTTPAIIRSSLLEWLRNAPLASPTDEMLAALEDESPAVRTAAITSFENLIPGGPDLAHVPEQQLMQMADAVQKITAPIWQRLTDPARVVRIEAARVLARVPPPLVGHVTTGVERQAWEAAFEEWRQSLAVVSDRGGSHAILAGVYENLGDDEKAIQAYQTASRIEPNLAGPRTQLAALYNRQAERLQQTARQAIQQRQQEAYVESMQKIDVLNGKADRLRKEELPLLERDAKLAPHSAAIHHQLGMARYLNKDLEGAEQSLRRAVDLAPEAPRFVLMYVLLLEQREKYSDALRWADRLVELEPNNPSHVNVRNGIKAKMVVGPSQP